MIRETFTNIKCYDIHNIEISRRFCHISINHRLKIMSPCFHREGPSRRPAEPRQVTSAGGDTRVASGRGWLSVCTLGEWGGWLAAESARRSADDISEGESSAILCSRKARLAEVPTAVAAAERLPSAADTPPGSCGRRGSEHSHCGAGRLKRAQCGGA